VKRYEGLFILNTAGKEEGVTDVIEKIKGQLAELGAKIETVQKMEKRAFVRVADLKHKEGFYVNYIFEATPEVASKLQKHFALNDDVFRTLFSEAPAKSAAK
jgi:ribosomal protein S6